MARERIIAMSDVRLIPQLPSLVALDDQIIENPDDEGLRLRFAAALKREGFPEAAAEIAGKTGPQIAKFASDNRVSVRVLLDLIPGRADIATSPEHVAAAVKLLRHRHELDAVNQQLADDAMAAIAAQGKAVAAVFNLIVGMRSLLAESPQWDELREAMQVTEVEGRKCLNAIVKLISNGTRIAYDDNKEEGV